MDKDNQNITDKSSKLASATYWITNFFDEKEPIKWKLRSLATDLISTTTLIKDNYKVVTDATGWKLRGICSEILGLLNIANSAGFLSKDNYSILEQEFRKYLEILSLTTNFVLPNTLISTTNALPERIEGSARHPSREERGEFDLQPRSEQYTDRSRKEDKGHRVTRANISDLKKFGAVSVKKNSRQSIIINVLKRKKEVMIKDITPLIDGCSEKTIQRELSTMVQAGILRKIGDKRWSRYTLV